jgi:hypothetical protein
LIEDHSAFRWRPHNDLRWNTRSTLVAASAGENSRKRLSRVYFASLLRLPQAIFGYPNRAL